MPLRRLTHLTLLFLVALAFAFREAPECTTLCDDVTNDGEVVECFLLVVPKATSLRTSSEEMLRSTVGDFLPASLMSSPFSIQPIFLPARAGQGLLQLVSEQRK
jgi:hypothetical protein